MMQVTDKVIDLISQYTDGQGLNIMEPSRLAGTGSIESPPADKPHPLDQELGQRGKNVFTLA